MPTSRRFVPNLRRLRRIVSVAISIAVASAGLTACGPDTPAPSPSVAQPQASSGGEPGSTDPGQPSRGTPYTGTPPVPPFSTFTPDLLCRLATRINSGPLLGTGGFTLEPFDLTPVGQTDIVGCRILTPGDSWGVIELRGASSKDKNELLLLTVPGGYDFVAHEIPVETNDSPPQTLTLYSSSLAVVAKGLYVNLEVLVDPRYRPLPVTEDELFGEMQKVLIAAKLTN